MKKGALFEKQVVEYFQNMYFPEARRGGLQGTKDQGDILGLHLPVTLELKNCVKLDLAGWMQELQREMLNAHNGIGAVIHKRRGKGFPGDQYVTMDLTTFLILLSYLQEVARSIPPAVERVSGLTHEGT